MGQTCTTIELQTNRATLGLQQSPQQLKHSQPINHIKRYLQSQKQKLKSVTLIQNSSQLIYQYNDMKQTVQKLRVNNWENSELYQQFTIQDFINDTTFIVKALIVDQPNYVWKVLRAIKVESMTSQGLMDVGVFYYNFAKIKQLYQANNAFMFAENCWVQFKDTQKSKGTFIVESQEFHEDTVPLRQLGKFMKKNDICWQDKEFISIIVKCSKQVQTMHENNFLMFEDFLISESGDIKCIGGLIEENTQFSQLVNEDYYSLGVYLLETLYGQSYELYELLSRGQLQRELFQQQQRCKFRHPQSISLIINLLKHKQPLKQKSPETQTVNIASYIQSYRVKTSMQPSLALAQRYIELKQYFKAKQILFQRLSLLMYQQRGQLNQQSVRSQVFNKLLKKLNITKTQFQQCFDLLQHIIRLQRRIAKQTTNSDELDGLIKEYTHLGVLLSFTYRKQQNFIKSLSVLERVHQFLGQDNQSWVLNLHLAECYLFAGRLDDAQTFYKTSVKFQINQANVCFFIKFYASVLNWQKAISLLRSYEGLIVDDYLYDLLISRILLSKALCISPHLQENQAQRTQTFCECLSIGKRIFDRKGIPQLLLCESYELIGDANFYLKDNQRAFQAYDKGLALARSIDYSAKQVDNHNQQSRYEPSYLQRNQLEYSTSMAQQAVQNSIYKRSVSQKSGGNQTFMSIGSLVSQTQQKQSSFAYQFRYLFNFDKKAIFLSSMANCRFLQRKYSEAIQLYEQARNSVLSHNIDLKNSIVGNMAICSMEMGKCDRTQLSKSKIEEGKSLLKHIVTVTRKQTPSKLDNDVNYLFLVNQLDAH